MISNGNSYSQGASNCIPGGNEMETGIWPMVLRTMPPER